MNVDFSFYYQPEAKSLFLKTREYFLGFYTYYILFRAFLWEFYGSMNVLEGTDTL